MNVMQLATQGPQMLQQVASSPTEGLQAVASQVADAAEWFADQARQLDGGNSQLLGKAIEVADQVLEQANEIAESSKGEMAGKAIGSLPGGGPIGSAVESMAGNGGSGGGEGGDGGYTKKMRPIIKEAQDVAVARTVAYNQWTQLEDLPSIMKAVESVEQDDEITSNWTVKIGPSRRQFKAEITEQVPDELIAWKSTGGAEHFGAVSFHEIDRLLCRIQLEMEYHPNGFIEKFGNLFLAPRKRARRELRLFKHYMELERQETGAWRGEIREGEVVTTHEENEEAEQQAAEAEHEEQGEEQGDEPGQQASAEEQGEESPEEEQASEEQPSASEGQGEDATESEDARRHPTRRELYELAKELDIEGRSRMTTEQLREVISEMVAGTSA